MTALVSVVIPAFNAGPTIGDAIASALAQTYKNIEVIICDDASTDDTHTIANSAEDPRVKIVRNESNLGEGASRDRAIAIARGQWVAVLDADDAWHPHRLEKLLQAAGTAASVMIFDDIQICHHTKHGMRPWRDLRGPRAFGARDCLPIDVPAARWASAPQFLIKPLIPMAPLKEFQVRHSSRRFGEDTEFFLRLITVGVGLRYVPVAYYRYRITPGSMSATPERARQMRDMLEELLPLFADNEEMQRALRRKIAYRNFTMAVKTLGFAEILQQLRRDPSLASELLIRCSNEVPYYLHRFLYGGSSR